MVFNYDTAFFGTAGGNSVWAKMTSTGLALGNVANTNRLDVLGGTAMGSYAGIVAPSNGLIVSGNVGIGISSPAVKLDVGGSLATSVIGTEDMFHITRGYNGGNSFPQVAAFRLGSYAANGIGN